MKKEFWLYGAACVSGILAWILISSFSGQTEAWDSELYLTLGIPALCLVAGALGFIEPKRSWRWGIIQILGQAVWMFASQGFGNLWPLGMVAFGIFAIPLIMAAGLGAWIAKLNGKMSGTISA
ncbi:MAG: hypothetical protein HY281_04100 [Nitrospirae bacterium]|nr:hypothetical protein [Nitrospirota bacterium]